jgi:diguanylate cyclase (GGDEF)-like protein
MVGFPTTNFSDSQLGLFSAADIRRLMRAEFDRAKRFGYPIVMLLVEVDRLDYLHDLYGVESKETILHGVATLMRSVTRASDFLGCMVGDRLLAVFPHTPQRAGTALAGRLLQGTRKLEFHSDHRQLRATLSIGIAHSVGQGEISFEEFLATAEGGLAQAVESGGDRFVELDERRPEVEALGAELAAETQALEQSQSELRAAVPDITDLPEAELRKRLRALLDRHAEEEVEGASLEEDILGLMRVARPARSEAETLEMLAEHQEQVSLLERRLAKLTRTYEDAKEEIRRLIELQDSDEGIASIYRTVQGIAEDDEGLEVKREMLSKLFEANLELRRKLKGES